MKNLLFVLFSTLCFSLAAQDAPVYDDMIFESDSMAKAYKPAGKNFIIIKSKRGTDGNPKTSSGDSIKNMNITDIVLVFTENEPSDLANRSIANRERWENLIKTYPEFFKDNPNLYNTCQCVTGGDAEALKKSQGFYVYIGGKPEPATAPEPKAVVKKEEKVKEEKPKKEEKVKEEKPKKEEKVKEEKVAKEEKVKEEKVKEEKPKKEKKVKEEKPKEEVVKKEEPKEEPVVVAEPVAAPKPKKQGYATPKKAKDAKVCRPPCYEGGDEGLNEYLKTAFNLSKKQKRHSGDLEATVTLMLHFDGSIKKSMIVCADEEFKKQVEEAIKQMDLWNPAVKGGVTIKSQVKLVLRYDNSSKQIKPFETQIIPRPAPKCTECLSDSQVFGE